MKKKIRTLIITMLAAALLSAGTLAHAAAFTDYSSIKYKTAVGVMSGAGIINGYTDGSFRPNEDISREQAAKMVAFAVLGEDGVKELPKEETGFTDVAESRWSAPYISWCRKQGLIGGYGDGSFDPTGEITGFQLAKMLLCATGYGANGEYSGSGWDLQSAKDGFVKGIFKGIDYSDPGANVTREEAALYIFNAVTGIEQVKYDESAGQYVPADGTKDTDNTLAAAAYGIITSGGKANTYSGLITENSSNSLIPTVIGGRELDYSTGTELLGHYARVYSNGQEGLKSKIYYIADESETVEVETQINGAKSFTKAFGETFATASGVNVYTDKGIIGEETSVEGLDIDKYTASAGTYIFYQGKLISYVPPIEEFAASVGEEQDGKIKIGDDEYQAEAVYSPSGDYASGDVVLAKLMGTRINIRPAESITGYISKIDTDASDAPVYTINGYEFNSSSIKDETGLNIIETPELGKLYRFYLDGDDNIFAVTAAQ